MNKSKAMAVRIYDIKGELTTLGGSVAFICGIFSRLINLSNERTIIRLAVRLTILLYELYGCRPAAP
jgi:hypothetical protein